MSVALLAIAVACLDWGALKAALARLDPTVLAVAILVCLLQFFLMGWRWYGLIGHSAPLPFLRHLKIYFYSSFLNLITPGNLGGDAYRLLALRPIAGSGWLVFSALIQERSIGLFAYLLACAISWLGLWWLDPDWLPRHAPFQPLGLGMAAVVGIALAAYAASLIRQAAWRERARFLRNEHARRFLTALLERGPMGYLASVTLSILALGLWLLTVRWVAVGLRIQVPWLPLASIVVLVELVRFLPISIQGIGVREGAYAWLFSAAGLSPEDGFVVGGLSYLVLGLTLLLTGTISLLLPPYGDRSPAANDGLG